MCNDGNDGNHDKDGPTMGNDEQDMMNNYPQVKCRLILISARGE